MLTIELLTYDGERTLLPVLLDWDLIYTGSVPCDSMSATCLYSADMARVLPKATRFRALEDGTLRLAGVVDAYEIVMDRRGLLVTVEGRGMAALLIDNEAEAVTYGQASTEDILANHVTPYGIEAERRRTVTGRNYAVASGTSQWRALRGFTHRYGGFDPYFTPEGKLVLDRLWGGGRTLEINDRTPLRSFTQRGQRYGVISEMLIYDKVQQVRHSVMNQPFASQGGCRRQLLYMPRSTADSRRYTGEYQIAQSALEELVLEMALPYPFAAFPGDRAAVSLDRLGLTGDYDVVEARSRTDASGAVTELTVSRRR